MANIARRQKRLVEKLAEACDKVGIVPKKGKNGKYNYQRWADVAIAFRHELFKRKVLLTSNETEATSKFLKTNGGELCCFVTLKTDFTLQDGESEDTITRSAFGSGMDVPGDKALYKAKTGALKYFLRGLGLIPDEGDDPEAAVIDSDIPLTPHQQERAAEYQMRAWAATCDQYGKTGDQAATYLRTKWEVKSAADLTKFQFDEAIRWAIGKEDLVSTLELSVKAKANGNGNAAV